ncbi:MULTISPECIES: FixH family protein [Paenibacillus]|uniref:YtkA-like domain-containing protein n=1 Tax=Paenibacillus borealis TaxID=160799 RepID=A0ABX3HMD6_PAEBO|nr:MULTISPECIES: FixH family protein [Paenibacillus]OMD51903.1 hypothetical protein BSK56_04585 [Paenibacillus borealis]
MMKPKKLIALFTIAAMSMIVSCSGNNGESSHMHDGSEHSMEPIHVELSWNPGDVSVNQKVVFEAVVTQGSEAVDDAKAVLFEIVNKNNEEDKQELEGKLSGNGTYKAESILMKEGNYDVTSHVTARTQHSMPTKELTVQP